jgi:hypothetical protein
MDADTGIISASHTLEGSRTDDPRLAPSSLRRETAEGRGHEEHRDADPESRDAAKLVRELAAESNQGGKGEYVRADYPLLADRRQRRLGAHRRRRNGDDGLIQHDHRQRASHRDQHEPRVSTGRHRSAR